MKRMKKAILLPIRKVAYRWSRLHLYYWADVKLFELRAVNVMPEFYYRWLFQLSMNMLEFKKFRKLAE